jgi:hypothetical protein
VKAKLVKKIYSSPEEDSGIGKLKSRRKSKEASSERGGDSPRGHSPPGQSRFVAVQYGKPSGTPAATCMPAQNHQIGITPCGDQLRRLDKASAAATATPRWTLLVEARRGPVRD